MTIEFLLSGCEHTASDVFCTEVACQRVDDDEFHIDILREFLDLVDEQHLVCRIVCACNVNSVEDGFWIQSDSLRHLSDSLRTEGVLSIDVEDLSIEAALF